MKITKTVARKVLSVVDQGLTSGLGVPEPGKLCVMAAISFALGLPHGDNPATCVASFIRQFDIKLNDSRWSSNAARARGMRREAIAKLGSAFLDEPKHVGKKKIWIDYVVEQTIRRIVPEALRAAAFKHKNKIHADKMLEAAIRCENEGTQASAYTAAAYASYAAAAYAAAAASYAADASASYAASAAAYAERDRVLTIAADICTEACVLVETQGSKWLEITEEVSV